MPENQEQQPINSLDIDISKMELDALHTMKEIIEGRSSRELNFNTLDDNDQELSEDEQKIKDRLNEVISKIEFIQSLINLKESNSNKINQTEGINSNKILELYWEKNIDEYSKTDAEKVLQYLESSINSYDSNWEDLKVASTLNNLNDKEHVRTFQKKLINIINWEKNIHKIDGISDNDLKKKNIDLAYKSKDIKDYSIDDAKKVLNQLNLSYKEYSTFWINRSRSELWSIDEKDEVNIFQEKLISIILWSKNWYNNKYIQWFNKEKWNFLIEKDDFEDQIQKWTINQNTNRLALSNYLIYAVNTYSETKLINIFTWKNLKFIYDRIVNPWTNSKLLKQLEKETSKEKTKKLVSIFEEFIEEKTFIWENFSTESFKDTKVEVDKTEDIMYLASNPSYIVYIEDINKLNQVIELYYKINKWRVTDDRHTLSWKLHIKNINKNIIKNNPDIISNPKVWIDLLDFNLIPDNVFESNIENLLLSYPFLTNQIFNRIVILWIDIKYVKDILKRNPNIEKNSILHQYIYANLRESEITNTDFLECYNLIISSNQTDKTLNLEYHKIIVTNYLMVNRKNKDYELINLAKAGFYWTDNVFKEVLTINNIDYTEHLIKDNIEEIYILYPSILSEPKIISAIMDKWEEKHFKYLMQVAEFQNLNIFLYWLSKYLERKDIKDEYNIGNAIYYILQDNWIRNNIISLFSSNNNKNLEESKYKNLHLALKKVLAIDHKKLKEWAWNNISENIWKINDKEKKESEKKKLIDSLLVIEWISKKFNGKEKVLLMIIDWFESWNMLAFDNSTRILSQMLDWDIELTKKALTIFSQYQIEKIEQKFIQNQIEKTNNLWISIKKSSWKYKEWKNKNEINVEFSKSLSAYFWHSKVENFTQEEFETLKKELEKDYNIEANDKKLKQFIVEWLSEKEVIKKEKIKFEIIKDNLDSYVEYVSNPDKKWTFEEHLEIEKQIEKGKINEKKLYNESNNYYYTNEDSYWNLWNWFTILWKNWNSIDGLIISEKEKKLTMWNPEATENLINFYLFFKELNLLWVWKYRKELITGIWDRTIDPNDSDSVKEEELRKFWNKLLTFIVNVDNKWETKEKINLHNINAVNQKLRNFSWANSMVSDWKTYNIEWEDRLTAYLRSMWIIWWAYFHINKFREKL